MFEEDLDAFLNTDEHAHHIVIQKSGKILKGIIDREYVESNDISGFRPVLTCKACDARYFNRGDVLEVDETLYKYVYQEKDGTGMTQVILELVS